MNLSGNQLTSLPAEIGQLTSLEELDLYDNQLTSVPAEIGQLTSLRELNLHDNQLTSCAGGDRAAHVADGVVPRRQSADERAGCCDTRAQSGGLLQCHLDDGVKFDE